MNGGILRAALLGGALVLGGCAGTDGSDAVKPFSEVQASDFVFESDPSDPGRGIFRVVTTEPMICSIAWGETAALGNFNNDLSMNGTGIIDHNVIMPGARAGGSYFFRVQGSTADGQLYQSELATFTLPEADQSAAGDTEVGGPNLAEGADVVEVSSEFNASWGGSNAVDGDLATEWATSGDGDDAFITIDLGGEIEIGGVEFLTRTMADGTATTVTFQLVADGGELLGPFDAGNPANPVVNRVDILAQVLRFEVTNSTGGNTGAIEIRVFAP